MRRLALFLNKQTKESYGSNSFNPTLFLYFVYWSQVFMISSSSSFFDIFIFLLNNWMFFLTMQAFVCFLSIVDRLKSPPTLRNSFVDTNSFSPKLHSLHLFHSISHTHAIITHPISPIPLRSSPNARACSEQHHFKKLIFSPLKQSP